MDEMDRSPGCHPGSWPPPWPEISDERVLAAFQAVPRVQFVPPDLARWAHSDAPLPIGAGQTISQPFVVALMTQALALMPGEAVLEIGTGSGYQTAILCHLAKRRQGSLGETVHSIEREPVLAQRAAQTLHDLGYAPHLEIGDGALGWPRSRTFDAIIVSAAPAAIPAPLWRQLREAGRMVIPIGPVHDDQCLWLVRKQGGQAMGEQMGTVRFVPLLSPVLAEPGNWVRLWRHL